MEFTLEEIEILKDLVFSRFRYISTKKNRYSNDILLNSGFEDIEKIKRKLEISTKSCEIHEEILRKLVNYKMKGD